MCRYRIRVRGKIFLWGSEGITLNLLWPMLLTVRVDQFGEQISLGSEAVGTPGFKDLGTLNPGETYTIPLINLKGVFAQCALDSEVTCTLFSPHVVPNSVLGS